MASSSIHIHRPRLAGDEIHRTLEASYSPSASYCSDDAFVPVFRPDPSAPSASAADAEDGFVYTSHHREEAAAYEVLVAGGEGMFLKNKPPAARSAVEALPSAVVAAGQEGEGDECAVCKDGVAAGQRVKRLPCSHRYHDDCIVPWLQVRNSCPLCRFELPTDDPEYESWKAGRAVAR